MSEPCLNWMAPETCLENGDYRICGVCVEELTRRADEQTERVTSALRAENARLREALRNAVEMIHDANGPLEYARANDWMRKQLAALSPPAPEAGGER